MPSETVFFHKGLAYDSRWSLMQPGFLRDAVNLDFAVEGKQKFRPAFASVNSTVVGVPHTVKRFRDILVEGDGAYLRYRSALSAGDFTTIYSSFTSGSPWVFREYKNFLHGTNGTESILIDEYGNTFPARIENPVNPPLGADAGSGSGPNGTYALY